MPDVQSVKTIPPDALLAETKALLDSGSRLVAISCTAKGGLELSYSFDSGNALLTLRLNIGYDDEVESISGLYSYAFLYENEIKELFGAKIKNIAVDFNDTLYKKSVATPFKPEKEGN